MQLNNFVCREPETIHRVGQLLIELHIEGLNEREYPGESAVSFVERLEAKDLRMFHKEVNHEYPHLCTELSFIQKEWEEWDEKKYNFTPLKLRL